MANTIELVSHLDCSADEAWERVGTSALLHHITAPLIRFVPRKVTPFPTRWNVGEYRACMFLLGFLPVGWQAIRISIPEPENGVRFLRDNGYGPLIQVWDHWIEIAPEGGGTRYVDRVTVEAGWLTPLISGFAKLFYSHRQRRWKALAAANFAALDS